MDAKTLYAHEQYEYEFMHSDTRKYYENDANSSFWLN